MTQETELSQRQERLQEILLSYVEAAENGTAPNREAFLAEHAEFADEFVEFLASYEKLNRLTSPLRDGSRKKSDSKLSTATGKELGQLGDFRLLREIARGGMGIVYEAEQISLHRKVALKVLPFASAVDARQLQRFRNEAEAAAHLHHSHIVPVFAVGSERGVHYYAMQFIEGQSLASLIGELQGEQKPVSPSSTGSFSTSPSVEVQVKVEVEAVTTQARAALSTEHSTRSRRFFRRVAEIGKQTAEALEYAHQMGIVHRDVKPANLLLDSRGEVWIADFGLAQFQSHVGLTMTGELLGTLRYVSPEQAMAKRGLVDHRTDIYSLGASIYELLTLKPVFDGRDRHALLHQIAFDEPHPPRTVDPSIPVELETIVLKALAKNPGERYSTAQELADDLQRFLDDKPIQAKRPSIVERTRKWVRRHPAFVAATLLVLFFGVVGFAASTAMIAREQRETQHAYERAKQQAQEAEQRFHLARRSADEMIRLAEEELADNPGMQNLRQRMLESALVYYQELIEVRREDPDAQAELATTRDRVKKILGDLAVLQGAGHLFLLKEKAVLGDLDVSKEQRSRITELFERLDKDRQESFRGFSKLASEEKQNRFLEMARANETAIAAILQMPQIRRLRQIARQCQGTMAFREQDVVAALKLTGPQKKQIRALELTQFYGEHDGERPGSFPKAPSWKVVEERRKSVMSQVVKLLSAEQARQWRELTGEPFTSSSPIFFPLGPPPPGGFGPLPPGGFGPPPWPKKF